MRTAHLDTGDVVAFPSGERLGLRPNGKAWHAPVVIELSPEEAAAELRRIQEHPELYTDATPRAAEPEQETPGMGHNSGAADPGLATDFEDRGPLAIRKDSVPAEKLEAFYGAVRSQGNMGVRQAAITNMLARARANPAIRHHDYRLLEQIAPCSRWEYRYCCQSNKALAYFAAQSDAKNIGRSLSNLLGAEVIAGVDVPRQIGGWPVTYYTLRRTTEDRSNQTVGNLNKAFKAVVSSRQADDLLPSSRPTDDESPGQVVPQTTCKSSTGGVASRPPDAQSVNSKSVKKEDSTSANAPVDATLPLDDERAQQAGNEPGTKSSKKRAAPRTQITPDWRPTAELIAWVKARWIATDQKIAIETDKFRSHHEGKGSLMASWDGAWRYWWNNGFHGVPRRPDGQPTAGPDPGAELDAQLAQRRRDLKGGRP